MPESNMPGKELVEVIGNREPDEGLLRSRINLEVDDLGRPKYRTEAEVEAEFQRRRGGVGSDISEPESEPEVIEGKFVEISAREDEEVKKSETPPKWERTLGAANVPGVRGRDALLKSARRQAQAALDLEDDVAEMTRIAGAISAIDEELVPPIPGAGEVGNRNTETVRVEIPGDEKELKIFLRERAREIIRTTSNDDALTLNNVRDKIILGLGFDPKTFTPVDLFAKLLSDKRDGVRGEFEAEIFARCVLRSAELKEWSYKAMADKGAAVNRYMNDMKGSESGGASAAVLDRETFLWLKNLKNEGDGLTGETVDRAFSMFVMLGEREPDFSATWAKPFEKYRPKKRKADGSESWGTNYYDPSYDRSLRARAVGEIESTFGKDATALAWQMFQAFKEEGNYNWQHYLSRDFTFAASRHSLATLLTPPVYIGSRRVYETKIGTFKDELERVALSALRVKTKIAEDPDPTPDDLTKTKDRLETDVYLNRARKGKFLGESPFEDQNMVKEGRMPQQLSYNTVKDGEKFRTAIVTIGELGKEADKGSKIGPAVGALGDLRSNGQSLVEVGVITQDELDHQIKIESQNVIWELSVENPANTTDLGTQSKAKPSFLFPSQLNTLFEKMGGSVSGVASMRYIGSDLDYKNLSVFVNEIRRKTWELLRSERLPRSDSEDSDVGLLKKEGGSAKLVLPEVRGRRVMGKYEASNDKYFDWLYRGLNKPRR